MSDMNWISWPFWGYHFPPAPMAWMAMSPALGNTQGHDDFAIVPTKALIAGHDQHCLLTGRNASPPTPTTSLSLLDPEVPKLPMADFSLLSEAVMRCPTSHIVLFLGPKPSL